MSATQMQWKVDTGTIEYHFDTLKAAIQWRENWVREFMARNDGANVIKMQTAKISIVKS